MATGAHSVNQELITLFADLDTLLNNIYLCPIQREMIRLFHEGYNFSEIAHLIKCSPSTMKKRMETVINTIKAENDRRWRKVIYTNTLGMKTKRCSRCGEHLPATEEFFSVDEGKSDMFSSHCKKCRNHQKRLRTREKVTKDIKR